MLRLLFRSESRYSLSKSDILQCFLNAESIEGNEENVGSRLRMAVTRLRSTISKWNIGLALTHSLGVYYLVKPDNIDIIHKGQEQQCLNENLDYRFELD